jgi:hypothetical protein
MTATTDQQPGTRNRALRDDDPGVAAAIDDGLTRQQSIRDVADIIATALLPMFNDDVADSLRARVAKLTTRFPLYPHMQGTSR